MNLIRMRTVGWGQENLATPPTTDKALPSATLRELPWMVMAAGLFPKNPKALGEATVSTLSWPRLAENFAPSANRRKSAVLT
jgi:hypothetical protein